MTEHNKQTKVLKEKKTTTSQWAHFIAGGTGGTVAMVITCPLEVIKTRLQGTQHNEIARNHRFGSVIFSAARDILTREGARGLWKGLGPNLVGVAPSRAIHFSTYNGTKTFLTQNMGFEASTLVYLTSAIVAGVTVATATAPIWLVKTRMQLQRDDKSNKDNARNYKNSFDCVRRVYREEGIRSFYKGLVASYIGVSESAIQFVLYERCKEWVQLAKFNSILKQNNNNNNNININNSPIQHDQYKNIVLSPIEYLTTASVAKLIAAMITYPHEVVRTRIREQRAPDPILGHKYKGFVQTIKIIAAEEGLKGLYGGMGAHLLRVVPNAAIMFFTYETVVKFLS